VLDGGDNEVFLHGTRLSRFMKSVEEATQAMGPAEAGDVVQEPPLSEPLPVAAAGTTPATDPWAPLIDAGLALIQTLAAARGEGAGTASTVARPAWIETDAATGKSWLKLPMPEPAVVQRLADGLSGLLAGLRP
jgi:hypothetical protein